MSFNSFTPHGDGNVNMYKISPGIVLIPLPLTGMETLGQASDCVDKRSSFNSFTPHGDGNCLGMLLVLGNPGFNSFTPHGDGNISFF